MSSLEEAAAALRKAAADLPKAVTAGVVELTALMEANVRVHQARAGAGSGRMRGVGRHGGPIGVKGTVLRGTGLVRGTGAAHLLDHDTKAHLITTRNGKTLSKPIRHPGTKGKFYFERAVEEVTPKATAILERHIVSTLKDL